LSVIAAFVFTSAGSLELKGFPSAVPTCRLVDESAPSAHAPTHDARPIGR
jgi:class 3 adenylate cyclase